MSGLQHYDEQIEELDRRIGRLALLCGADLSRHEVVVGLIKGNAASCDHAGSVAPEHRAELRALLMLKYRIEASCVDALGAEQCAQLIAEQDDKLRRSGFPPQTLAD